MKNGYQTLDDRDHTRLSFIAIAIINVPKDYRRLIKIVRDNDYAPPGDDLNRILDIMSRVLEENLVASPTKTRKRLGEAAEHLIEFGDTYEKDVGLALAWAFDMHNCQSKPRSE